MMENSRESLVALKNDSSSDCDSDDILNESSVDEKIANKRTKEKIYYFYEKFITLELAQKFLADEMIC